MCRWESSKRKRQKIFHLKKLILLRYMCYKNQYNEFKIQIFVIVKQKTSTEIKLKQKIIILMEFQSPQDENLSKMNQNDIHDIKIKYHNFYDYIQVEDSQEIGSDLDDLQDVFNAQKRSHHSKQNESKSKSIKRNPRVDEIPTVYLVTCIKTQYLPKKTYWDLYQTESETNQSPEKRTNYNKQQLQCKRSGDENDNIEEEYNFKDSKLKNYDKELRNKFQHNVGLKLNHNKIKGQFEREWNTEYIILTFEQFGLKQTRKRKLMHKQIQYCKIKTKKDNNWERQGGEQKKNKKIRQIKQKVYSKFLNQYFDEQNQIIEEKYQGSLRDLKIENESSENSRSEEMLNKQEEEQQYKVQQKYKKNIKQFNQESIRIRNIILIQSCKRIKENMGIKQIDRSSNRSNTKRIRSQMEIGGNNKKEMRGQKREEEIKIKDEYDENIQRKLLCGDNSEMEGQN